MNGESKSLLSESHNDILQKNALTQKIDKYYEKKNNEISKYIDLTKNYRFKFIIKDNSKYYIDIYDIDTNKKLLRATFDLIGVYNLFNSVWYWGWNIDMVDKKLVRKSLEIKRYSNYIKNNFDNFDPIYAEEMYYKLINGNFYTSTDNIDRLIKLSMYVLKGLWILPICNGKNNTICSFYNNKNHLQKEQLNRIEYIMLTKIDHLD